MFENENLIIKEVDVVLSKQFVNLLYILQFPIKPSSKTYKNAKFLEARIKPKQKTIDIEIAINTNNENYDKNTGKKWALEVDGKDSLNFSNSYKTDQLDKQIFYSSGVNIDKNRYCIASFQNSMLYVISLDAFVQMRPNIHYIDKIDACKNKKKNDSISETFLKPIVPRYAPKENEEDKAKRLASFDFFCNIQEDEKYIPIKKRSLIKLKDIITEIFDKSYIHNKILDLNMAKHEYIDILLPTNKFEINLSPSLPCSVISMSDLKSKSVADQIKILLECSKVMKFEKLTSFISKENNYDIECLLRCVQRVGILVQGCWVYKSELIYSGENSESLCKVRDFVLWSFSNHKTISRKDLSCIAKLPAEEEKELLSKIAKRRLHSRDWEFIMNEDTSFIIQYPDIVQRQAKIWEKKYLQITASANEKKSN